MSQAAVDALIELLDLEAIEGLVNGEIEKAKVFLQVSE